MAPGKLAVPLKVILCGTSRRRGPEIPVVEGAIKRGVPEIRGGDTRAKGHQIHRPGAGVGRAEGEIVGEGLLQLNGGQGRLVSVSIGMCDDLPHAVDPSQPGDVGSGGVRHRVHLAAFAVHRTQPDVVVGLVHLIAGPRLEEIKCGHPT